MPDTVAVAAKLPLDAKAKLDAMLSGRSLGTWLRAVADGTEQVNDLQARAQVLEAAIAEREKRLRALEQKLGQVQELLEEAKAVQKVGTTPQQLAAWSSLLSQAGVGVEELAAHIEQYGSLATACRELEGRKRQLQASVQALEANRTELEATLTAVKEGVLASISEAKKKAVKQVESVGDELAAKIRDYGQVCTLAGALKEDLPLATVLHAMTRPDLAQSVMPISVLAVLSTVRRWCELSGVNPKCRPPKELPGCNLLFETWELGLSDLLDWAQVALGPLGDSNKRSEATLTEKGVR
jgi:prefoldin subunit 5